MTGRGDPAGSRRDRSDMRGSGSPGTPPRSPWVLVDDLTVGQAAGLLERLTAWLAGPGTTATASCAQALSLGETDDPAAIASWADALAARLRHRAEDSQL